MNYVCLSGRLTKDPSISDGQSKVAKYTLAVDRYSKDGEQQADFLSCVAFGKSAEFVQNFLRKGTKIIVEGRIQTGSYTNKEGQKVYTTDIIVSRHEFCESKGNKIADAAPDTADSTPLEVPDGIEDSLPFK